MEEHAINYLYRLVYTFRDTAKCKTFPFKIFNQKCRMVTRNLFQGTSLKGHVDAYDVEWGKEGLENNSSWCFLFLLN